MKHKNQQDHLENILDIPSNKSELPVLIIFYPIELFINVFGFSSLLPMKSYVLRDD